MCQGVSPLLWGRLYRPPETFSYSKEGQLKRQDTKALKTRGLSGLSITPSYVQHNLTSVIFHSSSSILLTGVQTPSPDSLPAHKEPQRVSGREHTPQSRPKLDGQEIRPGQKLKWQEGSQLGG